MATAGLALAVSENKLLTIVDIDFYCMQCSCAVDLKMLVFDAIQSGFDRGYGVPDPDATAPNPRVSQIRNSSTRPVTRATDRVLGQLIQ